MKKFTAVILFVAMCGAVIFFAYLLKAYWPKTEAVDEFNEERYVGYREGYSEAMEEAPEKIESYIESDISDLNFEILIDREMSPEEAVRVLTNYIDGEPTSEIDLNHAIEAILQYYHGLDKIIHDIDDYTIDERTS